MMEDAAVRCPVYAMPTLPLGAVTSGDVQCCQGALGHPAAAGMMWMTMMGWG